MIVHPFNPIYDSQSRILILGTFPSVKSRENDFYYGHPQNRFWKVLSAVFNSKLPRTIVEKKNFLLQNRIALWDVISSCNITGSSDSSITNAIPNDLTIILLNTSIKKIYCNGTKAFELYQKYIFPKTKIPAIKLPSTSPANASWTIDKLIEEWGQISIY